MAVIMPDLKFKDQKTYFFCLYSLAKKLPETLKANGIMPYQYKILPIANAKAQHVIPYNVHIPERPEEVEWCSGVPASSLKSLCVLISYIDPDTLKPYADDILFEDLYATASEFIRMRKVLGLKNTATADDVWREIRRRHEKGLPVPASAIFKYENMSTARY